MHIGLYFGSFNPIHIGHLIVASHVVQHSLVDKIWFVVTPNNPLKDRQTLLNEYDRLHLVELAIEDNPKFRASSVEFHLPKPSYTIDTLTYLKERFPLETFSVILGSDSFQNLPRWKNYEQLIQHYSLIIYARPGFLLSEEEAQRCTLLEAPLLDISSSFIRKELRLGHSIRYLVPDPVWKYIEENRYYR